MVSLVKSSCLNHQMLLNGLGQSSLTKWTQKVQYVALMTLIKIKSLKDLGEKNSDPTMPQIRRDMLRYGTTFSQEVLFQCLHKINKPSRSGS